MNPIRSATACPRLAFLVALSASTLCGCLFRPDVAAPRDALEVTRVAADSEMVVVRRDAGLDALGARRRLLLKIAQDCLQGGFQTFAFSSIEEAEPHLPNLPPEAPDKIETIKTFATPSTVVPDIAPGTGVTVKFYKVGDPPGSEAIYAALIVANLAPQPQR